MGRVFANGRRLSCTQACRVVFAGTHRGVLEVSQDTIRAACVMRRLDGEAPSVTCPSVFYGWGGPRVLLVIKEWRTRL